MAVFPGITIEQLKRFILWKEGPKPFLLEFKSTNEELVSGYLTKNAVETDGAVTDTVKIFFDCVNFPLRLTKKSDGTIVRVGIFTEESTVGEIAAKVTQELLSDKDNIAIFKSKNEKLDQQIKCKDPAADIHRHSELQFANLVLYIKIMEGDMIT